jgi:predicted RNase H-like nuclease (RuvC/YqgF family)
MTFQKKTSSAGTEKNEKDNIGASEVKLKRELYEKDQELEELRRQLQKKEIEVPVPIKTQAPDLDIINQMQQQINNLSMQVIGAAQGKKLLFRQPTPADIIPMEEAITFTARSVIYIVASYIDKNGLEKLPPFKLITFQYAASDIRKRLIYNRRSIFSGLIHSMESLSQKIPTR